MKLPPTGLPRDEVLAALERFGADDLDAHDGRTWAYVFDAGPEVEAVGKEAFMRFIGVNALDPTVFPSVMRMENELVALAAALVGGDDEVAGNFTSGGTESILLAVKTARDRARAERPGLARAEMILPVTAHAAFHKAAHYFDVVPVMIPVDPKSFKADVAAAKAAVNEHTVLIVGSAPSYAHGVVDPIRELAAIALDHGIPMHVDACMGGFLLPYFKRLGAPVAAFDFSVPGVTSISMDLHKYAYCPKGASLILHKTRALREHQIFSCSGWTGYTIVNPTVQSSRSGGPVAAAWAVMHFIGDEGYLRHARTVLQAARDIVDGVGAIDGIEVMGRPEMSLIAVRSDEVDVFEVVDEMKSRGWYIQPQLGFDGHSENFHLSVQAGVTGDAIQGMLADLAESVAAARMKGRSALAAQLGPMVGAIDPAQLTPDTLAGLLSQFGVEGVGLPERMADINGVLNALPREVSERLLAVYYSELNHYRAPT